MDWSYLRPAVEALQSRGLAAFVWAECTIWETAWYLRGMDKLLIDMSLGDEKAIWLLDHLTDLACLRARRFAEAGTDILGLGDDIGMQSTTFMSLEMYRKWLKPRLARVIAAAREVKPDILISYHSCGYIRPLIGDFLEAGIDILNPLQPECPGMDFAGIHAEFGQRISFNGTIGTQRMIPFGTPEEIRAEVRRNLGIAGSKGGLFCCPTHMLEPEVPWENILAYVEAVRSFRNQELAVGAFDRIDNLYPRSTI
jgi:uroporphyrinogen decarboxylase